MNTKSIQFVKLILLSLLLFTLFILYCRRKKSEYALAAGSKGTSYYLVGQNISDVIRQETGIQLKALSDPTKMGDEIVTLSAINNCKLMMEGIADFAISQNDAPIKLPFENMRHLEYPEIRSVLPLYPEIFFIIYKEKLEHNTLRDLIVGRRVAMGPKDSGTANLAVTLFQEFGIDTTEYIQQYVPFEDNVLSDSVDVSCLLTGFTNPRIENSLRNNGKLFSLGNYQLAHKGSAAEAFCLKYPLAKPYLIPRKTYSNLPKEPVLTISVDAILLAREDVANEVVYDIIKSILEKKQIIAVDMDNKLLSQLTENFDPLKLRFPLHPGARRYLERNKPSFFLRYAELLALIVTIIFALVGGISTIYRWNRQHKKNLIDKYYRETMNVEKQIVHFLTIESCREAINKLKKLREEAFNLLIREKLRANESFTIFITFLNNTLSELQQRINELRSG